MDTCMAGKFGGLANCKNRHMKFVPIKSNDVIHNTHVCILYIAQLALYMCKI